MPNKITTLLLCSSMCLLSACATNKTDPRDPHQKFNRTVFKLNQTVDHTVIRPATRLYMALLPGPIRRGIANIFTNATSIIAPPNDLIQGKFQFFVHDTFRLLVNTTLGIGGIFDVASKIGLKPHYQNFGMTYAYYSSKDYKPPYLVVPFLGSFTTQTALGEATEYFVDPINWLNPPSLRYTLTGLYLLNLRSQYMGVNKLVDDAFDPYVMVRNAFFQQNKKRIDLIRSETVPHKDTHEHFPEALVPHSEHDELPSVGMVAMHHVGHKKISIH